MTPEPFGRQCESLRGFGASFTQRRLDEVWHETQQRSGARASVTSKGGGPRQECLLGTLNRWRSSVPLRLPRQLELGEPFQVIRGRSPKPLPERGLENRGE